MYQPLQINSPDLQNTLHSENRQSRLGFDVGICIHLKGT